MATRVVATKTGLKLVCEVSAVPVPRPKQVFPLPDLHGAGWPFLTLTTGRDSNTGALSITATVDASLPGRRVDAWTLHWSGLGANGTCAVAAGDIRTIAPVQASAPYQMWLSRQDAAGAVTVYPAVGIDAPHFEYPEGTGSSGGGAVRKTVTITASGATGSADLGGVFTILRETASAAGRFRLYRTVAERDADLVRDVSTDEAARLAGCVLEDVFVATGLVIEGPDVPAHAGSDGLCAWSWSGALGATIALDISQTEA